MAYAVINRKSAATLLSALRGPVDVILSVSQLRIRPLQDGLLNKNWTEDIVSDISGKVMSAVKPL